MKKLSRAILVLAISMLAAGCASGPKFSEVSPSLSKLSPDSGRIFIYRTAVLGAAVQPDIRLNGGVVGSAVPQGFFYLDRAPGNYEIETSTEVDRKLSFILEKGQTRYVRLNISMGFFVGHVYPELVENREGEAEIQECSYTGSEAVKKF